MNAKEISAIIEHGNNKIMSKIFTDLIEDNPRAEKMKKLYLEYDGDVPITKRVEKVGKNSGKANNKLINAYRNMIVDQGLSYTFGKAIEVELDADLSKNEKTKKTLKEFKIMNKVADLDYSTGFYSAITGYGSRLIYVDFEGQTRVMNVLPWEAIFVYSQTIDEVQFAMIFYNITLVNVSNPDKNKTVRYVEWYDAKSVYYYQETDTKSGSFVPDPNLGTPIQEHGFIGVPVIKYKNNDPEKGDFEMVTELIDAIDRALSDSQNEIEDYRNAYMVFKGVNPDAQTIKDAKETGAFGSDAVDFEVSFLTKDLDATFLEMQIKNLNANIYKFSKRVDMSDEKFSGSGQSGESRKWKLLSLENDATIKERKFVSANQDMYKLLESNWVKRNLVPKQFYLSVTFQFTRNLPLDLNYYGEVITKFWGKLSKKTIYSLLPFIEDSEKEIEALEAEQEEAFGRLEQQFGSQESNASTEP